MTLPGIDASEKRRRLHYGACQDRLPHSLMSEVGEVVLVGVKPSVRLDETGALPVVPDLVTAGRMVGLGAHITYQLLHDKAR